MKNTLLEAKKLSQIESDVFSFKFSRLFARIKSTYTVLHAPKPILNKLISIKLSQLFLRNNSTYNATHAQRYYIASLLSSIDFTDLLFQQTQEHERKYNSYAIDVKKLFDHTNYEQAYTISIFIDKIFKIYCDNVSSIEKLSDVFHKQLSETKLSYTQGCLKNKILQKLEHDTSTTERIMSMIGKSSKKDITKLNTLKKKIQFIHHKIDKSMFDEIDIENSEMKNVKSSLKF